MSDLPNFDLGLRHVSGMTSDEFIRRYCEVFRPFAYATEDNSLNEFEKLITHVLSLLECHRMRAKLLSMSVDPRPDIARISAAREALVAAEARLDRALAMAREGMTDE